MNTKHICQHCDQPLGPEAVEGLCPACLMKMGLGIGTEATGGAAPGKRAFTPPAPAALAELFPQFEILAFIGQGGMGAVYKARQKQLDRIVALKILPPGIGEDPAFAERFAREARAMAKLNHPGIVTIYDFGQAQGRAGEPPAQLYYFIMEFVDGVSLRQLLQTGRVEPREALAIVPQICDALQYAHDHGIVHRDIKPENILLDRQGHVKVADFGLAKLVGTEALTLSHPLGQRGAPAPGEETVALTDAGKLMGTPQYMAPEQVEHPGAVDHRADIYALGVVFYQMLTGELPGRRIEPPSRKVLIDVRLDEVVLRALERNPERRYDQASALKTQVETIASSTAEVEPTLRKPELQPPSFPWRKTVVWHAAGLLGLIGLLLLVKLLIDRYAVPLNEGRQLPAITRLFCGLGAISAHWWFLVIPTVLGLDVLLCWFASRLADRRGLAAWSVLLTLTLVFASAYAVIASVLPLEEMLRQRRASRPAFGQVNAGAGTAENGKTLSSRAKPAEIAGDEPAASSLQFRWVAAEGDTTSPADLFEAPGPTPGRYVKVRVLKELLLDGSAVARAGWNTAHDQQQQVMLELTPAGRQQFAALTAANINRQLAIIFEGRLLSTPVIRSAINSAEVPLPVEHDDLDHLLLALNRVSAKPDVPALAPPIETVMPQARESTNLLFLNLAARRWTTNELPFRPDSRESHDWLRGADADISGGFDDRYVLGRVRERLQTPATNEVPVHPIIRGYDLVIAPASSNSWQTATPAQIRFQWDLMTREPKSETHLGSAPGKLDTFYVRTRDNAFGLLQVLGFSDNPRGVRIRYKLVAESPLKEQSAAPEPMAKPLSAVDQLMVHAWDISYSLTTNLSLAADQWKAVEHSIAMLRDEGLQTSPHNLGLYRELAWLFLQRLALHEPGASQNLKTWDGWESDAPDSTLSSTNNPQFYFRQQWALQMNEVLGTGHPDFDLLIRPSSAQRQSQAALLSNRFKLEPAFMKEVDLHYGPLDWRLPESHAIYWAARGLKLSETGPAKPNPDELLPLHRILLQSLVQSFAHGALRSPPGSARVELGPNLAVVPNLNTAYEQLLTLDLQHAEHVRTSHRNVLRDAVFYFALYNRTAEAAKWFAVLGQAYPQQPLLDGRPTSLPSQITPDEYVVGRVLEDVGSASPDRVMAVVEALLFNAFWSLAQDEDERAAGFSMLAQRVWERELTGAAKPLPSFDQLKQRVQERVLNSQEGLDAQLVRRLRQKLGLPLAGAPERKL